MQKTLGGNRNRNKTPGGFITQNKMMGTSGSNFGTAKINQDLYDTGNGQTLFTKQQIFDQLIPVQRITGSRTFGDQLDDYQTLFKRLGNFKLSRIKANECNIYARGSVAGVQAHIMKNQLRNSTNLPPSRGNIIMKNPDVNIMDCLSGGPIKNVDVAVDPEVIGKVSSSHKPPIDVGRIADWLNKNHHLIRAKNYLHQDMSRNDPYNATFNGTYMSKRSNNGFGATGGFSSQGQRSRN